MSYCEPSNSWKKRLKSVANSCALSAHVLPSDLLIISICIYLLSRHYFCASVLTCPLHSGETQNIDYYLSVSHHPLLGIDPSGSPLSSSLILQNTQMPEAVFHSTILGQSASLLDSTSHLKPRPLMKRLNTSETIHSLLVFCS